MKIAAAILALVVVPAGLWAQTKRNTKPKAKQPEVKATPKSTSSADPAVPVDPGAKRNERPADAEAKPTVVAKPNAPAYTPNYFYEFSRPGFVYEKITIEHDESGKGTITFGKGGFYEAVTDPIELSAATLERIKTTFAALNFLDSGETYQTARDYSHMGNVTIRLKRDSRTREVKYNWTDNKDAKALMDEYRKVGNEYTWRFEMTLARDNQPLMTPGLVDVLDSYLRRNEISDATALLPFLTKYSTDERLPLIARNHIGRLISQIEKSAKK